MRHFLQILAIAIPVALAATPCSGDDCEADSDAETLIQTQVHNDVAAEGGSSDTEKQAASQGHSKMGSFQRDVAVQNHTRRGNCDGVIEGMGRGINIGNVYEFDQGDTNPEVVKEQVKWAHDTGFKHIRLPVKWDGYFDANSDHTKRVTEVVDYALGLGLYVVVNSHHEKWLVEHYDAARQDLKDQWWNMWTGIAGHFANRSTKLVFEILNEPHMNFGGWNEPIHPSEQYAIDRTREINGMGVDAVRRVPGHENRMIFVHPNAISSIATARSVYPDKWSLPGGGNDACVGITVHTYDPYDFCGENGNLHYYGSIGAMKKGLLNLVRDFRDYVFDTGIPVYVGEYGVGRQDDRQSERDTDLVREYYRFVTGHFRESGFATAAWNDPGWFAIYTKQEYGLHTACVSPYV